MGNHDDITSPEDADTCTQRSPVRYVVPYESEVCTPDSYTYYTHIIVMTGVVLVNEFDSNSCIWSFQESLIKFTSCSDRGGVP